MGQMKILRDLLKVSNISRGEKGGERSLTPVIKPCTGQRCICLYAHLRENGHGSLTIKHIKPQVLCETCLVHEYTKT